MGNHIVRLRGVFANGERWYALLAIWDTKSTGTRDMINQALQRGLAVQVISVVGWEVKELYDFES